MQRPSPAFYLKTEYQDADLHRTYSETVCRYFGQFLLYWQWELLNKEQHSVQVHGEKEGTGNLMMINSAVFMITI